DRPDPAKFTLYLNAYALPALKPSLDGSDTLRFMLVRPTEDSVDAKTTLQSWNALLGAPTAATRNVEVALRYNGTVVDRAPNANKTIVLQVIRRNVALF